MAGQDDIWIFGYGSLMWHPGFAYLERCPALLRGYHRAFCITSLQYRGTPERPGLVLGLDRGGSCRGVAYRVHGAEADAVMAYLHEREMIHYVYLFKALPVALPDRRVAAYTYIADRGHGRYAGRLSLEETARFIAQGRGDKGENLEYLENTVAHLDELGIKEGRLHELLEMVRGRAGDG